MNNNECQFLLDVAINEPINLSFPQFGVLTSPGALYVPSAQNRGLIVVNTGTGFTAFDAADPNHVFEGCSILTVSGFIGTCGCQDGNEFELINGTPTANNPDLRCPLIRYRVEQNGNTLLVFN
ncbi:MAG: hypothetical protein ACON5F_12755 [Jejuia sp.]